MGAAGAVLATAIACQTTPPMADAPDCRGELRPADAGIMDNLSSHKRAAVCERIEAVGAKLLFITSYSPRLQLN